MYQLVFCTCPDKTTAHQLASGLVNLRLAACINIIPKITSIYQWKGSIETNEEYLLLIKSLSAHYFAIETYITQQHPYECPEILTLPFSGSEAYLAWIASITPEN